jgi:hypothetical protein
VPNRVRLVPQRHLTASIQKPNAWVILVRMGSRSFDGVRFRVYTNDHPPRHVHAIQGETRVIIDLLASGDVQIAKRARAIRPPNAKKTDVRRALTLAAAHFDELVELWEGIHGGT